MKTVFQSFWSDEEGATAIEYGLIVALIVVAASVSFPALSGWVNTLLEATSEAMSTGS